MTILHAVQPFHWTLNHFHEIFTNIQMHDMEHSLSRNLDPRHSSKACSFPASTAQHAKLHFRATSKARERDFGNAAHPAQDDVHGHASLIILLLYYCCHRALYFCDFIPSSIQECSRTTTNKIGAATWIQHTARKWSVALHSTIHLRCEMQIRESSHSIPINTE